MYTATKKQRGKTVWFLCGVPAAGDLLLLLVSGCDTRSHVVSGYVWEVG